jgi:hypothetical protein
MDGIKSLHSKHVRYDIPKYARQEAAKEGCALSNEPVNCGFIISEGNEITREFAPSEVYGCMVQGGYYPALDLDFGGDDRICIVITEGYLLNNQGKTIDKFEPYDVKEAFVEKSD